MGAPFPVLSPPSDLFIGVLTCDSTQVIRIRYEVIPLFREGMSNGLMGMTRPRVSFAWFLTFHPYRGVFFWSPWILIALAGCVLGTRSTGNRRVFGWMGLWAFTSALLMNSSPWQIVEVKGRLPLFATLGGTMHQERR